MFCFGAAAGLVSGASSRSQRNGTAAVQQTDKRTYGIELLMVIDHAIYYRWYTESKETSAVNKQTDAVAKIKYYFSHLTNGIDLRYMNIEESDFSFYVRLSGIIISTTLSTSPWAKSSDGKKTSSARRVLLNADVALSKFKEWLNKKQFNLSRHDHAMLFTGYDLWRGYTSTGAYDARVKGLATLSGICTSDKVSLVEDTGGFRSIITAAHELGHSLGARHDGNGNSCSTSSSYIMAALIGLATEDNHLNAFTFSPCSISAFRSHLATLNRGSNCLLNVAEHDDEATHQQHLRQLPGQLYPPHEQCRQIYGSKSYYCGGFTHDSKICQELYCYDTNRKVCFKENDMRGARGTTCGNRKWCIQGVCTYNASAPAAPEVCVHGDHTSTLPDGKTCKKMGQAYPHYCYIATIRDHCCATCGALHNASNPGCEYGDRHNVCKTLPRWRCYSYQEYCCQSCSEKSTGVKGCEYGDRMANCMTSHCSLPNARDQCCHTCGAEENTTATTTAKRNAVFTTSTKASKKAVTTSITTYIIKQSSTTKMPAFSSIRHTVSKISTKYLKKTSVTNKPRALSNVSYPIFKRTTTIAGTSNFERTAHNKPANTTKSDFSNSKHAVRTTELSIHTFSVANQTATSGICMAAFTLSVWHWYLNY